MYKSSLFVSFVCLITSVTSYAAEFKFELETTKYEDIAIQRSFEATVEAVNKATIASQVSEQITAINFDVDDYVEKGTILVTFKNTQQRARLEQAHAAVREAKVQLKDTETELTRVREIYKKKLVAKAVLDKASAAYKSSVARLQQAEARLGESKEQFNNTIVKAPYSGIVTKRHVELGESPGIGRPLMTGLSLDKLRVVAEIPQQFISVLRNGCCPAQVILPGNTQSVQGRKLTISPIADETTRSFRIRVDLDDGQHGLYPGMFVRLVLDVDTQKRLLIPGKALVNRGEVTGVYIAEKGSMVFRHVRSGSTHADGRIEIHAGLQEGERVALDPVAAGIYLKGQLAQ